MNSLRELGRSGGKLFSPLCSIWLPRLSQTSLPCVPQHPVFFSAGTYPIYYHFLPTCLIKIMDWLFLVYSRYHHPQKLPSTRKGMQQRNKWAIFTWVSTMYHIHYTKSFTCLFSFINLKFYILYFSKVTKLREAMQLVQDRTGHKQQHTKSGLSVSKAHNHHTPTCLSSKVLNTIIFSGVHL